MQVEYTPYAALYKYALNSLVANASSYYEALRQLRTLQLKTDKELQAFAQKAAADIDGAGSMTALLAVQQQLMTDLMERELAYFRDLEKMTRDISSSASAALISGQNPWQERMAEIAEGAARFLAQATPGAVAGADRHAQTAA